MWTRIVGAIVALVVAAIFAGHGTATMRAAVQVEGNDYTSPTYGYTISWDEDVWSVASESAEAGMDLLILTSELAVFALASGIPYDDPEDCVEDVIGDLEGETTDELDAPIADEDAAGALFVYVRTRDDGTAVPNAQYVECRPLIAAAEILRIQFRAAVGYYEDALPLYEDLIAELELPDDEDEDDGRDDRDDEPADRETDDDDQAAEDEESAPRDGSGVDGDTYVSPTFGWSITWDADVWEVEEESSVDGVDVLQLGDPVNTVQFIAGEDYEGDPEACLDEVVDFVGSEKGVEDYGRAANADREPIGRDDGQDVAVYDATYVVGEDAIEARIYMECRTLVEDEAILAIIWVVQADAYERERPLVEDLLAEIDLSAVD